MWAVELPLTLGFGSQIDKGEIDKFENGTSTWKV